MMDFSQATQSYNMYRHMDSWEADCDVTTELRQIFSAGVTISSSTLQTNTIHYAEFQQPFFTECCMVRYCHPTSQLTTCKWAHLWFMKTRLLKKNNVQGK